MATSAFILSILTSVFVSIDDNGLLGKWEFRGFALNDEIVENNKPPKGGNYVVEFCKKNKLVGIAGPTMYGNYKVRKDNKIRIKIFISKGGDPKNQSSEEFDWRLRFNHAFGGQQPFTYSIENDSLKIYYEPNAYLLFVRIEKQ